MRLTRMLEQASMEAAAQRSTCGEANVMATAYTMHNCSSGEQIRCEGIDCCDNGEDRFKGMCDKNSCDVLPHRLGTHYFFGPGSNFLIDGTKPVIVTSQFITADGTDHGS